MRVRSWLIAVGLLVASAWLWSLYGFEARLNHDDGGYVYSGQQVLRGVAPFQSLFDHKGPLTAFVCAAAIGLGRVLGTDDLLAVRFVFLWISSGVVALLFLLVEELFRSRRQALITCMIFLGLWGFGIQAASGAHPKTLILLLAMTTLWATTRHRWTSAGFFAALAMLVWQPMGVFLLMAVVIGWSVSRQGGAEGRALLRVLVGAAIPFAATLLYFASKGALVELADGMLLFNLFFLESSGTVQGRLARMANSLLGFRWMGYGLFVGTLALLPLYPSRVRAARAEARPFLGDRFAPLLLTLPAPFLWSLVDFQSYPDLYVFLPYGAIGFGWILRLGIEQSVREAGLGPRATQWLLVVIALTTLFTAGYYYDYGAPDGTLAKQRAVWEGKLAPFSVDARVASVGAPQVLALMGRTNITSYGVVWRGMEELIDKRHPDGFEGWLRTLDTADVLIVDEMQPRDWPEDRRHRWLRFVRRRFIRRGQEGRIVFLESRRAPAEERSD